MQKHTYSHKLAFSSRYFPESYIDAIKVGFFRKSINNNDFWAKEIQQYRISPDFPFHFKSAIIANTPCGELSVLVRKFCNVLWSTNGNFLDIRIFDNDIARLESGEKLGRNHFRANLTLEKVLLIRKLRFVHLVNIFNSVSSKSSLSILKPHLFPCDVQPLKKRMLRI